MRRRALVLVNPRARRGREGLGEARAVLERAGMELVVEQPRGVEEIADLARRAAGGIQAVIVAGGDGSVNAAIPAVLQSRLPLGILPMGTANNIARTLGIGRGLEEAAAVIAAGRTRRIDVGRAGDRHFLTTASIGLSVRITEELTAASKRRWGALAYGVAAMRTLARIRPFAAEIEYDDKRRRLRAIQIVVGNGRLYGAALTLAEHAAIDDALLDCYAIGWVPWWRLLALLPALKRGRQGGSADVETVSSRIIRVNTSVPHRIDADGEIIGRTPATFRVLPRALEVFAPEGGA